MKSQNRSGRPRTPDPVLASRRSAQTILNEVLRDERPLDDVLVSEDGMVRLSSRDRAFCRNLVATVLRRCGSLDRLLARFLGKPPPHPVQLVLRLGAAQIMCLRTPAHAAVDTSLRLLDHTRHAGFKGLVNAVLRRVANEGEAIFETLDPVVEDIPAWLKDTWVADYGEETARLMALASLNEAPLDISTNGDADGWAERLGGTVLPTGSIRLGAAGDITRLPGFADGAWWVQDAAAALPARLLGTVAGITVADLCAAPGGKTAQLAAAGAKVWAIDRSVDRLGRLESNLTRLGLSATILAQDAMTWQPDGPVDAVLLDAPCSATGTIRRHPDILHLKQAKSIPDLVAQQTALLRRALSIVRPGGTVVYCVCSLQHDEGPGVVRTVLGDGKAARHPIDPTEINDQGEFVTPEGDLRTLPHHWTESGGIDGFYAARLIRR